MAITILGVEITPEPYNYRTYDDSYYEDYDKNWWDLVYQDDDDFDEALADDIRHGNK